MLRQQNISLFEIRITKLLSKSVIPIKSNVSAYKHKAGTPVSVVGKSGFPPKLEGSPVTNSPVDKSINKLETSLLTPYT